MKRIFVILLCASAVFLAACAGNGETENTGNGGENTICTDDTEAAAATDDTALTEKEDETAETTDNSEVIVFPTVKF